MIDDVSLVILNTPTLRRLFGCCVLYSIVVLSAYLALTSDLSYAGQAMMFGVALCAFVLSERFRIATGYSLFLYPDRIQRSDGVILTLLKDVRLVNRGALAFKPSNGFTLHLMAAAPAAWQPGLYWQFGRKIGVGGTFSSAQTKVMADQIALRLADLKEHEPNDI